MTTGSVPSVGYVGIGQMGGAMVRRLLAAGHDVTVFDLDPAALATAEAQGATAATSAAALASGSEVIGICVPAAEHVAAALDGTDGILAGAREGTVILVHSTVHPSTVVAAAQRAAPGGVAVFDACVAGGTDAAARGEVVLFAGGGPAIPDGVRRLLAVYSNRVIDAGPVGAGAALKIACNLMTYAQFAAASAAIDMTRAVGVETGKLLDAWRHIGQLGRLTEHVVPLIANPASMSDGFRRATAYIAEKDLDLAAQLGGGRAASLEPVVRAIQDSMATVWSAAAQLDGPVGASTPGKERRP